MNEDLAILSGVAGEKENSADASVDISEIFGRFTAFDQKLDQIISLLDKDVKIDESNNEKVDITEAEGKIDENEEYREEREEK